MMRLRIGTRTSRLALAQTRLVQEALAKAFPGIQTELAEVVTKGDRMLDRPLDSFGGKGVFTRELEEKLLAGEIDLAVHSAKDVPMELPEGLSVCSVLTRGTPWDVLVTREGSEAAAVLGTSSLRRELQIQALNPGTRVEMLRGNVLTRLNRLREGRYDGIILAAAGLERLGLEEPEGLKVRYLDDGSFLPAAGQGILAVEYRTGELEEIRQALCRPETEAAFLAERRFLKALGGSCNAPCAAYCRREGQSLVMSAMYAPDRTHMFRVEQQAGLEKNSRILERAQELADRVTKAVTASVRKNPAVPETVTKDRAAALPEGKAPQASGGTSCFVPGAVRVSLVGAGPGDRGLVTCKGLECIRRADVILYDNLISGSLLNEARLDAGLVYVGKRSGAHHLSQKEISRLLVKEALAGNYVVRLKGGDPLVFGRGSEEARELEAHGIAYEIVPGVSSAYSVPAYGGIPVTERGVASSFHVITGQEGGDPEHPALDYRVMAREEGTLVFLMGLGNLPRIVENLTAWGKGEETPAAVIQQGTTARQRQVFSDLKHIVEEVGKAGLKTPAIVVVGPAAAGKQRLNWRTPGPLSGIRILLTGTRAMVRQQEQVLAPLGAETVAMSLVESRPVRTRQQKPVLDSLGQYRWLVFTSANGVDQFFNLLRELDVDHRALMHLGFAVVGQKTGEALKAHGFCPDFIPARHTSACLADTWVPDLAADTPVLLLRAREGSQVLPAKLREAGIPFRDLPLYETWTDPRRKEDLERILPDTDFVTIASGSAARALAEMTEAECRQKARIISIGPETTRAALAAGLTVAATAEEATAEGMAQAVRALVDQEKTGRC